jgi:hypothetical protein
MTPRLILTLLTIAKEARAWPQTRHLSDEALSALSEAHVSTVDHIVPVMIIKNDEEELETPPRAASTIPRGLT